MPKAKQTTTSNIHAAVLQENDCLPEATIRGGK